MSTLDLQYVLKDNLHINNAFITLLIHAVCRTFVILHWKSRVQFSSWGNISLIQLSIAMVKKGRKPQLFTFGDLSNFESFHKEERVRQITLVKISYASCMFFFSVLFFFHQFFFFLMLFLISGVSLLPYCCCCCFYWGKELSGHTDSEFKLFYFNYLLLPSKNQNSHIEGDCLLEYLLEWMNWNGCYIKRNKHND